MLSINGILIKCELHGTNQKDFVEQLMKTEQNRTFHLIFIIIMNHKQEQGE